MTNPCVSITRKTFFLLFFLAAFFSGHSQSNKQLIHDLLVSIAEKQIKKDSFFYTGMFPSFRECGGLPHNYQPDNNVFFTAITAFALQNLKDDLEEKEKDLAEEMIKNAAASFPYFQNPSGEPVYGFWPTGAPIMPNTYYFKYLKSVFGQGDDADDSVIILMASEADSSKAHLLKSRLIAAANKSRKGRNIISTFRKYKDYAAYSTYLGQRMPPDFDFAVQCNIMYFMYEFKLPFVTEDSATIQLLGEMIKNRNYMKTPVYISPYYVKPSVLLYHAARLMGKFHIPELEVYKQQVIEDIYKELKIATNIMDGIILRTALLRLGENAPPLDFGTLQNFQNSNQQQFIFFQARPAFSYPTPFKQIFLHWSAINYFFYCPAYNETLLLEYLVTKRNHRR